MRKLLILGLFLFVGMSLLNAQTVEVELVAKDWENKEALIGANIWVNDKPSGSTDENGKAIITILLGGNTIRLSYIGYDEYVAEINTDFLEGAIVDVLMKAKPTRLMTATVTGSKFEKPLAESSVSIEVLQPQLIENTAPAGMDEMIDKIPGVQMLDGQANIRGGSGWSYGAGSRVMLLLDDIPILSADAGRPNWEDLPIENIGQIEVLKGASSALYGSSALNGIINFKTDYATSESETKFNVTGVSYDMEKDTSDDWSVSPFYTLLVSGVHKQKFGKLDLIVGGMYKNEESFLRGTFNKYGRVSLSTRYRQTDNLVFGLNANLNPGKSKDYFYWKDKASFFGDEAGITTTKRLRFNVDPYVKLNHGNFSHKLQGRFYSITNDNINNQDNSSFLTYGEYQSQYRHDPSQLVITGGMLLTHTSSKSQLYSDTTFSLNNSAVYLQADKKFGNRLGLNAGVRYERNVLNTPDVIGQDTIDSGEISESKPIFRFGANYKAAEATFLRASWGQGYRFPSLAEKFIDTQAGGFRIKRNVQLQSEEGWSAEIGLRQGIKAGAWTGYTDLSFFWSEYEDMIEFAAAVENFELFLRAENVGGTVIKGMESVTYMKGIIGNSEVDFQMGYMYIDPKFKDFDLEGKGKVISDPLTLGESNALKSTSNDNVLKYRSKHNFKFDAQINTGNLFYGGAVNYTSQVEAIDMFFPLVINGVADFREENKSGNVIFDLRAGWDFGKLKTQIQVKNILDERYTRRPAYLESPRSFTLRVDYNL